RPHRSPPGRALRRRTPARRDRAGVDPAAAAHALRRADRQPRFALRGAGCRAALRSPPPAAQHPDRGHPQRAARLAGPDALRPGRSAAAARRGGGPMNALTPRRLALRALTYYWRTNLAVVLGIATAVAVLAGALIVGDTVRGSLHDLVTHRLGKVDHVVQSGGFFREALAREIAEDAGYRASFDAICPMVITQGQVTDERSGHRAAAVDV